MPELAAGTIPISSTLWVYCKISTAAEDLKISIGSPVPAVATVSTTGAKWVEVVVSGQILGMTAAKREALAVTLEWKKAKVEVYEVYLELNTETETAAEVVPLVAGSQITSNAEKHAVVTAVHPTAETYSVAFIEAPNVPTAVTDSFGSEWTKDASTEAGGMTLSLWSCKQIFAAEGTITVTTVNTSEVILIGVSSFSTLAGNVTRGRHTTGW